MSTSTGIQDRLSDLLDELAEATPIEKGDVEFDPFRLTAVVAPRESGRRLVVPLAVAAATITITVAGAIFIVTNRDRPPSAGSPVATQPGAEVAEPRWFEVVKKYLPAEFEHIAVTQSVVDYVNFEAVDLDTGKRLDIYVSRGATSTDPGDSITLDAVRAATWTDPNASNNVSLPDGRLISATCSIGSVPDGQPSCPPVNGVATDAEDLRKLVLALADEVTVADLPPATDSLPHVRAATIRTAVASATSRAEDVSVEFPEFGYSFVQYGTDSRDPEYLVVRTVSGFLPSPETGTARGSATTNGRRATWQVMPDQSVWFVYDSASEGALADQILDAAVTLEAEHDPAQDPVRPVSATMP